MAYTTITAATIGLADGDTSPQRLDGTVRITPRFPSLATSSGFIATGPVVVSVVGGDMPETEIPAMADATGVVEFHLYDRSAGPVKMPHTEIPLEPDTTISLHDFLPLGVDPVSGMTLIKGETGPQGPQGERGVQGPKGDKGDTGATGPEGDTGATGPKGEVGNTGPIGPQGPQGPQGTPGEDGTDGTGVEIKGDLPSVADLPASGVEGDAYLIAGDLHVWDVLDSAWVNVGPIQGPQGQAGPQGPEGIQGPTGPEGPQGPAGVDGAVGPDGLSAYEVATAEGYQGTEAAWLDDLVGPAGPAGADSTAPGPEGPQGPQGDRGPIGPEGPQGATGATGTRGLQGEVGPEGPAGSVELTGATATITVGPTSLNVGGRDAFLIHTGGSTDGVDLNDLYGPENAGIWEVYKWGGGPTNLPADFSERGVLEVVSNTTNAAHQRIVARADGRTWVRSCQDQNVTPAKWSDWRPDRSAGVAESSRSNLAIVGDSLAASHNLTESLNTELNNVNVYGRAWNGETSDGILLRLGAKSPLWTIAGGVIPGSATAVTVTTGERLDILTENTYYTGSLAGVPGRLTKSGSAWSFLRDSTGTDVAATKARLNPAWTKGTARDMIGVIMGRNDISMGAVGVEGGTVEHVLANAIRLIDWLDAESKLYFFMGTINRTTEPKGSPGYETVVEFNKAITSRFPGQAILIRDYLVHQAIHDLGITPTQDDLDNMDNDCPPPSVMFDMTHYTDAAAAAISANVLKPWLEGRGYI